jgi:hypothetical protein
MRHINLYYTKYFNNKYNLIGHLFEGRYKAEIIENDAYNQIYPPKPCKGRYGKDAN